MNGRVQVNCEGGLNYNLFEENRNSKQTFREEAIKGTHSANRISAIFFSDMNMDALQDGIRYKVYIKSCKKFKIDRQSTTDIKVILRAVYLEHAQHSDIYDKMMILEEIRRLNGIVIDYCVERILQEINMYMRYKADISNLPVPLARGQSTSAKGTKVLFTKEF